MCDLRNEFERVALDLSCGAEDASDSGLGSPAASGSDGLDRSFLGAWDWTENDEDNSNSEEYHTADEDSECSRGPCTPTLENLDQNSSWSCEEEDRRSSVSSCSSYKSTYSTPEHSEELLLHVFLTE